MPFASIGNSSPPRVVGFHSDRKTQVIKIKMLEVTAFGDGFHASSFLPVSVHAKGDDSLVGPPAGIFPGELSVIKLSFLIEAPSNLRSG